MFAQGIKTYGTKWNQLQALIKTRSSAQIRSHAQKEFAKRNKLDINKCCPSVVKESSNESVITDDQENSKLDKIKELNRKILETTYCNLVIQIKYLVNGIRSSAKLRSIYVCIEAIVRNHAKLVELAIDNKPLSSVELKNIAALKKEVDAIVEWYRNVMQVHLGYTSLKYLYHAVLADVVDLPNFSFIGLIRKSTRKPTTGCQNGFIPYVK